MLVTINGRHYSPSFNLKDVLLEKITLEEVTMENWGSVLLGEERKQDSVPRLCNNRYGQNR